MDDEALLAFEKEHPTPSGKKNDLIRDHGITPIAYYQRLNKLIDTAWAREKYPVMLAQLERLRKI
ncbi:MULTISPECIES: DUF3263 domain-containing protein [Corynebacterium]|uniref:DUF3263 domain-containing protein n=2 Tax=Corynebacterium glucuronolyticum TaxID=39791 RepID=A0A7T4EGV0_9CORY|nr:MULTISPECIES: DUF3263 domain-containing protein [Corynebacterium]EEI25999.1 hypothetical protein HMPREF0294_2464 [Corynebacterium glucuronolyticum ATCC 51867]EEI64135.1 hypothetical protein HMPREF0293_0222 [Corynebacterium glucuronolyticum ATCC 51866]MCT1442010.1 DUF3263 domain-containing protein [Corynebacterium glucuronolyticum]MCT1563522.1 DUF3263 domain-containing protein [Corynebacterium glucuronolyticum]OFO46279.1 hypothetical protein HMPREF3044_10575 [Corynebacterium sp. HMSC073D01]